MCLLYGVSSSLHQDGLKKVLLWVRVHAVPQFLDLSHLLLPEPRLSLQITDTLDFNHPEDYHGTPLYEFPLNLEELMEMQLGQI